MKLLEVVTGGRLTEANHGRKVGGRSLGRTHQMIDQPQSRWVSHGLQPHRQLDSCALIEDRRPEGITADGSGVGKERQRLGHESMVANVLTYIKSVF